MGILQAPARLAGQVGVIGAPKFMVTTDNLATLTAAGYLNNIDLAVYPIGANDVLGITYSYNTQTNSGTFDWFTVTISNGTITIVANTSTVVLPTIANHIATYTNTSGGLSEDPATAISGGNIQAGLSGTAGKLTSFPGTAANGSFSLAAVNNSNNFASTLSNSAVAQAVVYTLPDPGAATANILLSAGTNTMAAGSSIVLAKATGTEAANAVTVNAQAGVITTSSLTTAGGASYAITWTNSFIASSSAILLTIMGGTNTTENITLKATAGSSTSTLTIYNNTASTNLNGTILIGFLVV